MVSNLRTMDFQQVASFIAAARHGGLTAAASQLGLAKSAVSKHISQLERQLDLKLLERSSRRVTLTREGERLLPRFESLFAEGEQLLAQAQEEHDRPEGVVRIAATPEFGGAVASLLFPLIGERYPQLQLVLKPAYSFEDLQDPAFDLALRVGRVKDERLVARRLGVFHRIVVASPLLQQQQPVQVPDDLRRADCLLFSGRSCRDEWTLQRTSDNSEQIIPVSGRIAVQSFHTLLALAEQGQGHAMVPDFVARASLAAGRTVHCLADYRSPPMTVYLAHRFGAERIKRIAAVIETAIAEVPALLSEK